MRGVVHLLSLLPACLGIACAAIVTVAVDEDANLSSYETWDWLPDTPPLDDGTPGLPPSLVALVAHSIGGGLHSQGLRRSSDRADCFVQYDVSVVRRAMLVQQPIAAQRVDSYSSDPSYWVEGSNTVTRMMNDLSLVIRISEAHGQVTWVGSLEQRVEEGTRLPVEKAVATLLTRFAENRRGKTVSGDR